MVTLVTDACSVVLYERVKRLEERADGNNTVRDMDARKEPAMDRFPTAPLVVTDDDVRSFLAWADRERAINELVQRGKLGYGEFLLRRQLSYDTLLQTPGRAHRRK